ncbi:MAG: AMP-binding protein [Polyangia bacterium]|jgi:fatty-acyl-CoA synthase|nr:AMP-binding protein [Polyangia bacterium]
MGAIWNRLARGDSSLAADALRLLRVGSRTGLLWQQRPAGVLRTARILLHHPLGAGLIHALNAGNAPSRLAVVDGSQSLTYGQMDARLSQLVHGLRSLGLGRGDRLALMAPNGWPYLLGFFGALRGGFAAVHVSYRLTAPELRYILEHSGARALLFDPRCLEAVKALMDAEPFRKLIFIATSFMPDAPDVLTLEALLSGQPESFPRSAKRLLAMPNLVYTSGTTGAPKGAVRDFARLSLPELMRILDRLPFRAGERHLVVCPLYHSAAQAFVIFQAAGGSTLVLLPRFDPEETLRCLATERIDSVLLTPTMIRLILDLPEAVKARYRPGLRLRSLVSGAAPFPQPLREEAIEFFGEVVHDFYGSTEVGWTTLVGSKEMLERPSTVGRPIPGTHIFILDDEGRPLPPGEVGEIFVTTQQRIEEYYRNAEATSGSRRGEAQASGDLGWLDEAGYLFLAGRRSDLVISGGVNVYPSEIEQALVEHPAIREAAVLGVPDDKWGERVVAFLVGPKAAELPEIEAFCRERLAGFKVPKQWELREELPHNATGKVLKRLLKEELLGAKG